MVVVKALLYVLLLGIALVLYYFTKAKTNGRSGSAPLRRWLQQRLGTRQAPNVRFNGSSTDAQLEQVSLVLDDIYREFMAEAASIRKEMSERIEKLETELKSEVLRLDRDSDNQQRGRANLMTESVDREVTTRIKGIDTNENNERPSPQEYERPLLPPREPALTTTPESFTWEPPSGGGFDVRYFQIFDEIQKGLDSTEIAAKLHIDVREVERVRKIMSPSSKKTQ